MRKYFNCNKYIFVDKYMEKLPVVADHICEIKRMQGYFCENQYNEDGTVNVTIYKRKYD